ncbi:ABC transporter [Serinibacter arcticus]|uniref:ABC transporter n=1 Tax=Serinibacter arcticus TaxID=1655435 RepID=A0A2U1ZVH9_9MICO|nr:ABC transporter permease [Serinibacter arcticus]PWD50974.1 ABC transporter [Serinibacter arcticus]
MSASTATAATDSTARPGPARAPFLRLTALHVRAQFLENIRVPIAVISSAMFPALAAFFFVVPNPAVNSDPVGATQALAQLGVFGVMSACLFTHGTGVADDRSQPFDGYVRTLPAGAGPRMIGRVMIGLFFTVLAVVPLALVGVVFTSATIPVGRLVLAIGAVLAVAVPFTLLGFAIGYSMSSKAAIAVVQVVLFPLAFAGGLFLPPEMFPGWLDTFSTFLPSRAARELMVAATTGAPGYSYAIPVFLVWTAVFAAMAFLAYRNDQGRRFR